MCDDVRFATSCLDVLKLSSDSTAYVYCASGVISWRNIRLWIPYMLIHLDLYSVDESNGSWGWMIILLMTLFFFFGCYIIYLIYLLSFLLLPGLDSGEQSENVFTSHMYAEIAIYGRLSECGR